MVPRGLLLAGGVLTAGCASSPDPPPPPSATPGAPASCLIAADSTGPARTITAAFEDPADGARALRADLFDTPIRLDCEGRPAPGLAVAWSRDTTARYWTLELREPAASDTGLRWTAGALAAAWRADPDARAALESAGVETLVPIDARRLVVGFSSPAPDPPPLFADRALGVARDEAGPGLEPAPSGRDLRDAIDGGADLIHTGDPDLLDYARDRPGLTLVPLPWSRRYLLVLPADGGGVGSAIPADTLAFRNGLARDAVRADARVPHAPNRWESGEACRRGPAPGPRPRRRNAIAYASDDRVALDLAERIVALAATDGMTARGLAADSLAAALRNGDALALVIGAPMHTDISCREAEAWVPGGSVVPLIETRGHAILRRGTPPLVVEWDGTLRPARSDERAPAPPWSRRR